MTLIKAAYTAALPRLGSLPLRRVLERDGPCLLHDRALDRSVPVRLLSQLVLVQGLRPARPAEARVSQVEVLAVVVGLALVLALPAICGLESEWG